MLDTHYLVWLATAREKLRSDKFAVLIEPRNEISVSAVSFWESRLKWNSHFKSGKRKGPVDPVVLARIATSLGIPTLPLEASDAAAPLATPLDHADPFDELLLVQAQERDMKLFTRDKLLVDHPCAFAVKASPR